MVWVGLKSLRKILNLTFSIKFQIFIKIKQYQNDKLKWSITMNKKLTSILITTACLAFGSANAEVIRIAHDNQLDTPLHKSLVKFKNELESQKNLDLSVEIYEGGQLGGVSEVTDMVQINNMQMTAAASVLMAPYIPEFNVLDLFFLFNDEAHAHRVLDSETGGKALLEAMSSRGFKGLGFGEVGFRHITSNLGPIDSEEVLSKVRLRSANNPMQIAAWRSVSATPIPLTWGEIYTSLQQNLINSQESAAFSVKSERFNEVQSNMTLSGHIYTNFVWFMNADFFNGLTTAQKNAIEEAASKAIAYQRDLAMKANNDVIGEMESLGVKVSSMPDSLKGVMAERMNSAISEEIRKRTGPELFDQVLDTVKRLK